MLALSARRIALMQEQFSQWTRPAAAPARVLMAVDIAAAVMLVAPAVNRAVMGAISAPSDDPGDVLSRSRALWAEALGAGAGLSVATCTDALEMLPDELAVAFRGVLSFWTAGELGHSALLQRSRAAAATVLLGFAARDERAALLKLLGCDSAR